MRTTVRRLAVGLGSTALATAGIVVTMPTASADANSCIRQLSRGAVGAPSTVVITNKGSLPVSTASYNPPLCSGMTVSIGISRVNGFDFRNRGTSQAHWERGSYYFYTRFALGADDAGTWITRQLAVRDRSGRLAVRTFTSSTTPHRVTVKRASVLTGTPTGVLRPNAAGKVAIRGSLKAWHSTGRLINLQNQKVLVQTKLPGNHPYRSIATLKTGRTGTFGAYVGLGSQRGKDVRLLYVSPFQVIASDGYFLGRVR
jgi:hypothetical protein